MIFELMILIYAHYISTRNQLEIELFMLLCPTGESNS